MQMLVMRQRDLPSEYATARPKKADENRKRLRRIENGRNGLPTRSIHFSIRSFIIS